MLDLTKQLHQLCSSHNLKFAPEKSFYILLTVKFLEQENGNNTSKPIFSKVDGIRKLKMHTPKTEVMRCIDSMNIYYNFIN